MNDESILGSGPSQLIQLIQKHGYNKDVDFVFGKVIAPPPNLRVRIENTTLDLDKSDLTVAQHLTKYTRNITIRSTGGTTVASSSVSATLNPPASITQIELDSANFTLTSGYIDYLDELKAGDRVIMAEIENGQHYVVLDRAVRY